MAERGSFTVTDTAGVRCVNGGGPSTYRFHNSGPFAVELFNTGNNSKLVDLKPANSFDVVVGTTDTVEVRCLNNGEVAVGWFDIAK